MEHFSVKLEISAHPVLHISKSHIYMFNFNTAIHMPTRQPTGQQPTQKSHKKHFLS